MSSSKFSFWDGLTPVSSFSNVTSPGLTAFTASARVVLAGAGATSASFLSAATADVMADKLSPISTDAAITLILNLFSTAILIISSENLRARRDERQELQELIQVDKKDINATEQKEAGCNYCHGSYRHE
ncbi:hypothetical protein H8467_004452 [Salmonella enterica]|nr:hypothetical protein [Salmonella enterica]